MPSSARPRKSGIAPLVLLLGTITAIGPMSIDLYLPAFPELTKDLSTSESMVQVTLTACLVGLAVGQILIGPLSDAIGRRRPLLVGMSVYALASIACAFAPTIEMLTVSRFLQGLSGAAGTVLSQALLRDLVEGPMVARVMSRLMLVMGVAPVLAPTVGGQLLPHTGWRGLFWVLTGFGVVLTLVVTFFVRETLPAERRVRGGVRATVRTYRRILSDRLYLAYAAVSTLGFVMIFGYVSGSPFAFQEVHGVSPQTFGLLFGLNSIGMVIFSQLNARLVLRIPPQTIMTRAVPVSALAALALLFTTTTGMFGIVGLAVPLFVLLSTVGLVLPNAGASALNRHPESAGSAAAFVGMSQFVIGAFAGPLIGIAGTGTAVPMAGVITFGALGMLTIVLLLRRRSPGGRGPLATEAKEPAATVEALAH